MLAGGKEVQLWKLQPNVYKYEQIGLIPLSKVLYLSQIWSN